MAQPIPLQVPPRDPARELRARLDRVPEEHGEAILVAYDVLQELHDRGVLEIVRGALAASDDILERVVDNAKTPEAVRAIRNLIFWRQILGSIEPDWFKGIFQAIPEGIAQATTDRDKPVRDRKSTRLNSSHRCISYAVFCLKKKKTTALKN